MSREYDHELILETWIGYFADVQPAVTLDSFVEVLERFEVAENDYLC